MVNMVTRCLKAICTILITLSVFVSCTTRYEEPPVIDTPIITDKPSAPDTTFSTTSRLTFPAHTLR